MQSIFSVPTSPTRWVVEIPIAIPISTWVSTFFFRVSNGLNNRHSALQLTKRIGLGDVQKLRLHVGGRGGSRDVNYCKPGGGGGARPCKRLQKGPS